MLLSLPIAATARVAPTVAPVAASHGPAPLATLARAANHLAPTTPDGVPAATAPGLIRAVPASLRLSPASLASARHLGLGRFTPLLRPGAEPAPLPRTGTNVVVNGTEVLQVGANLSIGSLTVEDHAVVIVENAGHPAQLEVNGNVLLEGSGALLLNVSASLVVNESYDNEWSFEAENNSTFFALGANLSANGHQWVGIMLGNANVSALASNFGYPNSWFPVDVAGNSSLWVDDSYFLSDIELLDTSFLPSTARVTLNGSIGMNLWTHFRAGESANLSFPAPLGYENWSFPGPYNVTGVGYQISVTDSYVGVHAIYLWAGSQVTVTHTTDLAIAFAPTDGTLSLTGLREQYYGSLNLSPADFSLTLYHTSVLTWNFYPDASASLRLANSQVGEIIATGNAAVVVLNSNLTGDGGYYSVLGAASLAIYNTRINDEIIAGGSGTVLLENSSDNSLTPHEILATSAATITSIDLQLGLGITYAAQDSGRVYVEWNVTVSTSLGTVPVPGALVRASWTANGTLAAQSVTDRRGNTNLSILSKLLRASGTTFQDSYTMSAVSGWNASEAPVSVLRRMSVALELLPLVAATSPANGSLGVPLGTTPSFNFGFPMDSTSTDASLLLTPSVPATELWTPDGTGLTVTPSSPLAPNTAYSLSLGPGAQTADGVGLPGTFLLTFRTVALPAAPLLTESNPATGATGVSTTTNLTLGFSAPMDPTSTSAAFAVSPAVPSGAVSVLGADLVWSHGTALAFNTTYTVSVASNATSAAGISLASPIRIQFRTVAAPAQSPTGSPSPSPMPAWLLVIYAALVGALLLAAIAVIWARTRKPPVVPLPVAPAPEPPWRESSPTGESPPG
jgi:Big-like domain-containing protein